MSDLKMTVFDNKKIIWNKVTLEKDLILNDDLLKLSLQRKKFFSQKMPTDIMRNESPSLDYCKKLLCRGPDAFTQFIDILIERKQNVIVVWLLATT